MLGANIILPKKALSETIVINETKSANCVKDERPIEPIIGHLKSDFRLSRNLLKGASW
ncbi:hypothetical protein BSPWISOXPB_3728 [uncultured Gammaproteobacteria bacterium]|nr:hypothetical protein BSPWISOXPB_3728 [uncultured Gammaproteobacteria bacterium]